MKSNGKNYKLARPQRLPCILVIASVLSTMVADLVMGADKPLGTAFTYQGQLKQSGSPVNDVVDFRFSLHAALDGGAVVGVEILKDAVDVVNGLFTVDLDFGASAFNGEARWLEVSVRAPHDPTNSSSFSLLEPRIPITATPYAMQTRGIFVDDDGNVGIGTEMPTTKLEITPAATGPTLHIPGVVTAGTQSIFGNERPFLAIGRSSPLAGTDSLTVQIPTNDNQPFGGMYMVTTSANGLPFYGYATGGSAFGWSYISGFDGAWRLDVGGQDWVTVTPQGRVGIGNSFGLPSNTLSVAGNADVQGNLGVGTISPTNRLSVNGSANVNTNLGIGITTPERRLHVVGGTDIGAGGAGGYLMLGSSASANMVIDENEVQAINNGAIAALSLNALGGNVGIGLTGPTSALHVAGDVRCDGATGYNARNPNNTGGQLILGWLNDVARIRIGGSDPGGTNGLDIQTTSDRSLMRLLHSGNVGIGTTSPETLLHLSKGDAGMPSNPANTLLTIEDDAAHFIRMMVPNATETGILFGNPANGGTAAGVIFDGAVPNGLSLRTGTNDTQMVIDSSGRLGLGTLAPSVKAEIVSNGTALRLTSANADLPFLDLKSGTGTDPATGGIRFMDNANNVLWQVRADTFGEFSIRSGSTSRIRIDPQGENSLFRSGLTVEASTVPFNFGVLNITTQLPGRFVRFNDAADDNIAIISEIGSITFNAGGTVSYNAFTGGHYAWSNENFEEGMLVSMTGVNRRSRAQGRGEPIYGIVLTSKPNDSAVLGAYSQSISVNEYADTHIVSSVGNGDMWVVDRGGGDIEPGDYLISSDVPGCAMKDDPARFAMGHVIAKAADRLAWSGQAVDGRGVRRARISVLFTPFVRSGGIDTDSCKDRRIAELEARLERIEQSLPHADVQRLNAP